MHEYWRKQSSGTPLFPELFWSRPEHKQQAGKLAIIGGNAYEFAAPAEAYTEGLKAGVGIARVILPDSLRKTIGSVFESGEFAPSTPSGSFSQQALDELVAIGQWADGVLIAGDLGRNSETAIVLEKFSGVHNGQLTITKDAADYFTTTPQTILQRPDTLLVLNFAQAQKLIKFSHYPQALTFNMDILHLAEILHTYTKQYAVQLIIKHSGILVVAAHGQISTTKLPNDHPIGRVATAAQSCVWWLQNPTKPFEALTTALSAMSNDLSV